MKILVLGGTRFFGRYAVHLLVSRGHEVVVLSRGVTPFPFDDRVGHVRADRNSPGDVASSLSGETFDAVFDNSAMSGAAVQEVLHVLSHPGKYVLTSSGAVYHGPGEPPLEELSSGADHRDGYDPFANMHILSEDDAPAKCGWLQKEISLEAPGYRRGKLEAESVLVGVLGAGGIPNAILRPPQIEGPRDPTGRTEFFARRVGDGRGILLPEESRGGVFQKVFSGDLASAVVSILESESGFSGAFNVAGPQIMTMERYCYGLAIILGVPRPEITYVPRELIRRRLGPNYSVPVPSPKIVSTDRLETTFGFQGTPYADWMGATLRWIMSREVPRGYPAIRQREIELMREYGS